MGKIGIFIADGCEEIEALTVVDIARRAGLEIEMISIMGRTEVTGSHGIAFQTETTKEEADFAAYDGIVLPGGMPGTIKLGEDARVGEIIRQYAADGKLVAAICAAPSVLGKAGLLRGKRATCHPGFEEKLDGAEFVAEPAVVDGNIITSRGMGTAIAFALEIVRYFMDDAAVEKVRTGLVY